MDNALSEIIKSFTHFLRDFLIYFVSGLIVSLNIFIIDYLYYNSSLWELLETRNLILINLLLCYVLGHICMAVYFVLIEITRIDKKIKKCLKVGKAKEKILPELYDKKPNIYKHFIERYDNLNLFRWNLSAGFFINGM